MSRNVLRAAALLAVIYEPSFGGTSKPSSRSMVPQRPLGGIVDRRLLGRGSVRTK